MAYRITKRTVKINNYSIDGVPQLVENQKNNVLRKLLRVVPVLEWVFSSDFIENFNFSFLTLIDSELIAIEESFKVFEAPQRRFLRAAFSSGVSDDATKISITNN